MELDRRAHGVDPSLGVARLLRVQPPAGHIAQHRGKRMRGSVSDAVAVVSSGILRIIGRAKLDAIEQRAELFLNGFGYGVRVEGLCRREHHRARSAGLGPLLCVDERSPGSGYHDAVGSVVASEADTLHASEPLLDLAARGEHCHHPAFLHGVHEPPARVEQPRRLLHAQHACTHRGRVLAGRVSGHRCDGVNAKSLEQLAVGERHREHGHLRPARCGRLGLVH
mmetsp:Transcript_18310/g.36942  ORF Transcript_18310/g.36942 Transcript_18310/m.36942 type:complete len:224 (+) Transcript_18310:3143-3814(+)